MKLVFLSLATVLALGCSEPKALQVELLTSPQQEGMDLPFSEAVAYGDLLFLSGQIGNKPGELTLVDGGVQAQTRQTMLNIATVLERHGSSLDKIIKCTIFLGDMSQWADMNVAYIEVLGDHRPARSAFGANGLALDGAVEIECIAGR